MQVFDFDTTTELYNVVVVRQTPCAGVPKRDSFQGNYEPLEWPQACKWCRDILKGIGREWNESKFVDVYIELASCPRPWTPEILAAFNREMRRESMRTEIERQRDIQGVTYLVGQLRDCRAAQGITDVKEMTAGVLGMLAGTDDRRDHAAIENAALI